MEALIGNVEAMIVMYLPVILAIATPLINWFTVIKRFKDTITKDTELKDMLKKVIKDNAELKRQNITLIEQFSRVKVKDNAEQENKEV